MSETFNDAKFSYLTKALGVTSGDIDDLEYEWLRSQVDSVYTLTGYETNIDLWHLLLEMLGYGSSYGTIQDRQMAWLYGDYGYTGTINDRFWQLYSTMDIEAWLLTDVDANQVKDVDGNFIAVLATS